jgi:3-oxoacyl-[acyl-carrier protein] reductase
MRALPASFNLSERVALITGAGSPGGIGFACARLLAHMGARVVLTSTTARIHDRARELQEDLSAPVLGVVADLTTDDVDDVIRHIRGEFQRIDIVVNNAGMTSVLQPGVSGSIGELTVDDWRRTLDVNLTTAFSVCKAAVPLMSSGFGRIINITSVTGPVMAMRSEVAYAAAKAGMVGMTRGLAIDLADRGITVNAVAPGWVTTDSSNAHEQSQGAGSPMQRSGTAEEVAGAVAWLASPSGGYTTGQLIVVDGGNSIAEERA